MCVVYTSYVVRIVTETKKCKKNCCNLILFEFFVRRRFLLSIIDLVICRQLNYRQITNLNDDTTKKNVLNKLHNTNLIY